MRTVILLFFCVVTFYAHTQTIVNMNVDQLPKYGYTLSKSDTLIVKGQSLILGKNLTVYGGSGNYEYSWLPSKLVDNPSSATPIATPESSTIFYQKVTDGNGCVLNIAYTVKVTNPVPSSGKLISSKKLEITVTPNPVRDFATVTITGEPNAKELKISLIDNMGRVVKRRTLARFSGNQKIDFEIDAPSGIYSLTVEIDGQKATSLINVLGN